MCLKPEPIGPVPERTVQVAKAAFPKGNTALRVRDDLGGLFEDSAFAELFPSRGQPGLAGDWAGMVPPDAAIMLRHRRFGVGPDSGRQRPTAAPSSGAPGSISLER